MRKISTSSHVPRLFQAIAFLAISFLAISLPAESQSLSPMTDVAELAVGHAHACALSNSGGVKCWGLNNFGQLGNGTTTNSYIAVQVVGLQSGVASISAGYRHTCAVTDAGGVKCWGKNLLGQLGDGTTTMRTTPVDVSGLSSGVATVSAGGDHTCALDTDGELRCWGFNGDGELGIGNRDRQTTPVPVIGGQNIAAVATGYSTTCAITGSGGVSCWGVYDRVCNSFGCAFGSFSSPNPVSGLSSGVTAIAAGEFFQCAVVNGAVKCWGDNYDGQLGNPDEPDPDPFTLFDIDGVQSGVDNVSAGLGHACARLNDGSARCWGDNTFGVLGDGTGEYGYPAVAVTGPENLDQVIAGGTVTCGLTSDDDVLCWGGNGSGQLGDNDPWFRLTPTQVPGLQSGVVALSVGDFHSCAVTSAGAVRCWGGNGSGQVGNGTSQGQRLPVTILSSGMSSIGAGARHTCAAGVNAPAQCWGSNTYGQLGNGEFTDRLSPSAVSTLGSGVSHIDAGSFHTCARTTDNRARCWGWNIDAQLGNGGFSGQSTPGLVANLFNVGAVDVGGTHSCARLTDGRISCWGNNNDGQIGNGTDDTAFVPSTLPFPNGVTAVSAGTAHTCAVAGGAALCWGDNDHGQVGNGLSFGFEDEPAQVSGLGSGVREISAGDRHSCAVTTNGSVRCWGDNSLGQLGDGSTTDHSTPESIIPSGITRISAGLHHTCALSDAGAVRCWGSNQSDQLGIGRRNNRVPGPVLDNPAFFVSGFESTEG